MAHPREKHRLDIVKEDDSNLDPRLMRLQNCQEEFLHWLESTNERRDVDFDRYQYKKVR